MTAKELLGDLNGFYPIDDSENPDYEKATDILRRRVEAVMALHFGHEWTRYSGKKTIYCGGCREDWPCATIRALDGEPEGER